MASLGEKEGKLDADRDKSRDSMYFHREQHAPGENWEVFVAHMKPLEDTETGAGHLSPLALVSAARVE